MRFYRALLHLYPASFRGEYGAELCSVFATRRREASGMWGVLALWIDALSDVLFNATAAHIDTLRQDLRYTARALRRSPGFAVTVLLVVALGIGANTAAFSLADFVLVRPLPFPEPDRLVKVWERVGSYGTMELSPANYRDWKTMNTSFTQIGAYTDVEVNMTGRGEPQRVQVAWMTSDVFPALGVQPALGRLFTGADESDRDASTVLLSYGTWQTQFGGEPGIIGRQVVLDGKPFVVIGVMPRDFFFPNRTTQLWKPMRFREDDYAERDNTFLEVVGRLRDGVSIDAARAEMNVIAARLERQFPQENEKLAASVVGFRDELSSQARLLLIALCGAALCILVLACANLASLLLARSVARRSELAVRTALGAGRERLVRQMTTESGVLALVGGALGTLVAIAAVPLLGRLVPQRLPIAESPSVDLRVLAVAGIATVLTGLAFGVFPAMRASAGGAMTALRDGSRSGGGRRERVRAALVVVEVVASVVLLISAGLLVRAMGRIQATDPGFRADHVLTLRTALPVPRYDSTATRVNFYRQVLSHVRALPGVSNAAYATGLPMALRGGIWAVSVNGSGEPVSRTGSQNASLRFVTPAFFATLGIPLRRGRDIDETDTENSPPAIVVSESFAKRYWPTADPLGQRVKIAGEERTVIGVVGNVRVRGLERLSEPQVYVPSGQQPNRSPAFYMPKDLVVRSATDPEPLLPAIRRIVHAVDADQPISNVRMMTEIVADETASRAAQLRVLGALAAIAFLLAGVGIHGLLAFTVSQRSREIGVRMALGAQASDIVRMVVRQGVVLVAAGVVPGVLVAYWAARTMAALLAGVAPGDPATFGAAVGLCLAMAVAGCLLPARRASRVSPVTAIRAE
jgi:predicted permease